MRETAHKKKIEQASRFDENEIRSRLLSERSQIVEALKAISVNGNGSENRQDPDFAVLGQLREVEFSHREGLSRRLRQLDDALMRLADEMFGLCAECGNPIGEKRLASDFAVPLCLKCQEESESAG